MLFDLRGAGRRRTVKAVYITLALLMGLGLVGFGIGGSGALNGGLFDAITGNNSGGDGSDRLRDAERRAAQRTRTNPQDAAAWAQLARARFNLAGSGDNVDAATGAFTPAGVTQLRSAGRAWEEHLELAGDKPDTNVARIMVQAYGAIGEFDDAARAQELVAAEVDTASAYVALAQLAYDAGQIRKGDLARNKALDLTEPDMRESIRGQLDEYKTNATQKAVQDAVENAPQGTPTPEEK